MSNLEPSNVQKIAVVIPCYKVKDRILPLLALIEPEASMIYVVDDACPDKTGAFVRAESKDPRVKVIELEKNQGVGGAVMAGYQAAIDDGAEVIVKMDGDGQMDPSLMMNFVDPILEGQADYTKGNRFYDPEQLWSMPAIRLFGNAVLSLMAKISTGYWNSFDPNNGYTAIHAEVAKRLSFNKISPRYFFETDLLFRLNIHRAVVADIPMAAKYADEVSNLNVLACIGEFSYKHVRNFFKRIFYNYYLRDVSLASIELPIGVVMLLTGLFYGGWKWYSFGSRGQTTPPGTAIVTILLILLGIQLILTFLSHDIGAVPRQPIYKSLRRWK